MGETRVNLQHLLEDIRDTYPFPIEEAILTELVANALDSGASEIRFLASHRDKTLAVGGIEIVVHPRTVRDLGRRVVAEHARERQVTLQHLPVHRGAEDARQVLVEQHAPEFAALP